MIAGEPSVPPLGGSMGMLPPGGGLAKPPPSNNSLIGPEDKYGAFKLPGGKKVSQSRYKLSFNAS